MKLVEGSAEAIPLESAFYMVMGKYDMVALHEAPNDEAAAKFSLTVVGAGSIRTTTMKV